MGLSQPMNGILIMSKDDYALLFPTTLWSSDELISIEENDRIAEHIIENKDKIEGKGAESWFSGVNSPTNSFAADFNSYNHPIFKNLLNCIDEKIKQYADLLKFRIEVIKSRDWWWNVYENGNQYQEFHGHVPFHFSGVYFCKAPHGSAPITFRHPNFNHFMPSYERNELNAECNSIEPIERSLLIFPSNLIHCVSGGSNTEPRITISFNYG